MAALRRAGCVAAEEEALELAEHTGGKAGLLGELVARRAAGEPLAWILGSAVFCGERLLVDRGVYVPRWQSEPLAVEAARRLPERGVAVDLCTGSGAIAVVLARHRPGARVLATELDTRAAACARANGVEVLEGDMAAPLPTELAGTVDVVTAVVPYVPTAELHHLPRDVLAYEPLRALDGGPDGLVELRRAAAAGTWLLRPGGSLLLELGGDEAEALAPALARSGYRQIEVMHDEDGDLRAVTCLR